MNKQRMRLRRSRRGRARIKVQLDVKRLTVHRTPRHIYAQIIVDKDNCSNTLIHASTLDKEVKSLLKGPMKKVEQAMLVGKVVAQRALKSDIKRVAFDRSGFRYHGRIKALAEAAREAGLEF